MASYIQLHSVCLCNIRPSESKKKFVHGVYNYWMMQINHLMFPAKNRLLVSSLSTSKDMPTPKKSSKR